MTIINDSCSSWRDLSIYAIKSNKFHHPFLRIWVRLPTTLVIVVALSVNGSHHQSFVAFVVVAHSPRTVRTNRLSRHVRRRGTLSTCTSCRRARTLRSVAQSLSKASSRSTSLPSNPPTLIQQSAKVYIIPRQVSAMNPSVTSDENPDTSPPNESSSPTFRATARGVSTPDDG